MKTKIAWYTPRLTASQQERKFIAPEVSILTKIILGEICLGAYAMLVMKIVKKSNKRRHHAHAAEDDEPSRKRSKYESEDSSSEDEYVLISTLTGNITHGSDDWIIDSGASKHMGFKEYFVRLSEHESPHKVKLGYDYQYPIKGSGEYSY